MKNNSYKESNNTSNTSTLKLNKDLEIIIASSDPKQVENIKISLKNYNNNRISVLKDNKIPETEKNNELKFQKNLLKKGGMLISNEVFEDSNKNISSDSETKRKKINYKFLSNNRKGKKRK